MVKQEGGEGNERGMGVGRVRVMREIIDLKVR
jgi:hypothetical protein